MNQYDLDFDDLDYREEEYHLYYEHSKDNFEFELDLYNRSVDVNKDQ